MPVKAVSACEMKRGYVGACNVEAVRVLLQAVKLLVEGM